MSHQAGFTTEYKFVSKCAHCGKPMASMGIDRWDRRNEPGGEFFERDVYLVWVNPEHDCDYLKIVARSNAASGTRPETQSQETK